METLFSTEFGNTLIRFLICVVVNWSIIGFLYYRKSHRRDFSFTFMIMTVAIFFLVYFMMGMDRGKATMGVGLGLFGIFSIMRYRTDSMPVREMTYLFVIICLSVVHAMATDFEDHSLGSDGMAMSYAELVVVDVITVLAICVCEAFLKVQSTKLIQYDRPELITPDRREELLADLETRTGLKITKIDVGGIDYLRDTVVLRVTYQGMSGGDVDGLFQVKKSQWRNEI
ncbi:MAG: DUF4956 domain-containing protein [Prevotella sp.]|nr:DUF4956 domain-containing protein [Prevotella sp.]